MVMHSLIYLPLLFPVPAALAARPLAERLAPWLATWLLTTCALALAALSCVALGVLVVAGLVRLPLAALVGDWSPATVRAGDSVSKIEAAAAGALLVAAVLAGVRMLWRRMRALAAAAFEAACLPGPGQLVVVDDTVPDAYALPGLPGRVVVSTGMLDALNDADRKAMLAHERAHLACHHYAFVAAAVAYTVERWADERAATTCGDRRQVARAVGKAALATTHHPARRRVPEAVLGLLERRRSALYGAGPVPRRVAALLAEPHTYSPPLNYPILPLAAAAAVVGASALCAFAAAHDLHLVLKLAGAG